MAQCWWMSLINIMWVCRNISRKEINKHLPTKFAKVTYSKNFIKNNSISHIFYGLYIVNFDIELLRATGWLLVGCSVLKAKIGSIKKTATWLLSWRIYDSNNVRSRWSERPTAPNRHFGWAMMKSTKVEESETKHYYLCQSHVFPFICYGPFTWYDPPDGSNLKKWIKSFN